MTPAMASRPGVFTRDLSKALLATGALEFGAVPINEVPTWADHMPYGGVGLVVG